jgi:hypothetical protein
VIDVPEAASTVLREEFPDCIGEWTHEVSIGEGWLPLARGLCRYLQGMSTEAPESPVKVLQVKEKFGGLRFYLDSQTEAQALVIQFAEMLSFSICERCGGMRDVAVEGAWRKALCRECRASSRA